MLHAISSQISILVAGLQRLEGQQRHPQPPPPPPVPDGQPPPPPPPSSTPSSVPATSVRPGYPTVPVTLVATSDNRMEHTAHVHTVSVSTPRECRRRRRSRHREPHRRRSRSRSHHTRPLGRPANTGPTSHHRAFTPKHPPAVKAMPACRPSGPLTDYQRQRVLNISMHACFANMRSMLSRSLSCLVCPAVISFAMQLSVEFVNNLVAVLNVLASQVATALDTLNFALATERNQQSDTRVSPKAPRNSRHGLRPCIITERISSDRSRSPTRIRTRPLDTSSTWYIPALSPPRAAHRDAADSISGRRPESMLDRLPPLRPLAPLPPHSGGEPGQTSPTTPDSDSDGSVRPHPGASSFRPSPTGTFTRIHYCPSQCTS